MCATNHSGLIDAVPAWPRRLNAIGCKEWKCFGLGGLLICSLTRRRNCRSRLAGECGVSVVIFIHDNSAFASKPAPTGSGAPYCELIQAPATPLGLFVYDQKRPMLIFVKLKNHFTLSAHRFTIFNRSEQTPFEC